MNEADQVLLVYGSANRDEREFSDPDTFDIRRTVDRQLAFGHGIHFCLGASLARLEAQIVYSELLGRSPEWTVTGAPERMHSGPIRGLLRLPVSMNGWQPFLEKTDVLGPQEGPDLTNRCLLTATARPQLPGGVRGVPSQLMLGPGSIAHCRRSRTGRDLA